MGCLDLIAHVRLPKKSISETVELEFPSLAKLEAGDDFFWTRLGYRRFGNKNKPMGK